MPAFGPSRVQQGYRAGGNGSVERFPRSQVVDGQGVVGVAATLRLYVNDDGGPYQVVRREFIHSPAVSEEAGGGGQVSAPVFAHGETTEKVPVAINGGPVFELRGRVARPDRNRGRDVVAQADDSRMQNGPERIGAVVVSFPYDILISGDERMGMTRYTDCGASQPAAWTRCLMTSRSIQRMAEREVSSMVIVVRSGLLPKIVQPGPAK